MSLVMKRPLSLLTAFACGAFVSVASATEATVVAVSFSETPAPVTVEQMVSTYTTSVATLTYADGTTKDFPLNYNKLFGVKDKVGRYAAGQLFNAQMQPLKDHLGQPVIAETPQQLDCALDGVGLVELKRRHHVSWHRSLLLC